MRLNEQWIREGFSSYYVVKKEQKISYEKNVLRCHTLACLLPCEFRVQDEEEYYYYETGIYTPLKDRLNRIEPRLFFAYLLEVFEEAESYLLNLDHLKLDLELVFLDKEDRPVLCYLPEQQKNILEQLQQFIEQCINIVDGSDKKKIRFYYEFHSFLVKEKPNMEQMKDFLDIRQNVEKVEAKPIKEYEENEFEKQTSEVVDHEESSRDNRGNMIKKILSTVMAGISFVVMVYFVIQILNYGFYYTFLIGFTLSFTSICVSVYVFLKLWKKIKNKSEIVDFYDKEEATILLDDKTTLLEEDDKTVLLLENPIGRLIPENKKLEEIILTDDGFIIGSSIEGTDYQLCETGISRRHIKFYKEGKNICCEDLNSTNGVKINGKKIQKVVLKDGDKIKIGLEEFRFKEDESV